MGGYFSEERKEDAKESGVEKQALEYSPVRLPKVFEKQYRFNIPKNMSGIEKLENYGVVPAGVLNLVFQYLPLSTILECSCTCRLFNRIIQCQIFWKQYFLNQVRGSKGEYFENLLKDKPKEDSTKGWKNPEDFWKKQQKTNWKKEYFDTMLFFGRNEYFKKLFFDPNNQKVMRTNDRPYYNFDFLFKFILNGESGVGKTSLLRRFTDGVFTECMNATIGVDFSLNKAYFKDRIIKLQIWDTGNLLVEVAGQERFRTITRSFYKGAKGILMCFSVDNMRSLERLEEWYSEAVRSGNDELNFVFVGLKIDLVSEREVFIQDVRKMFDKLNKKHNETHEIHKKLKIDEDYCECSSKDGKFIELAFGMLIDKTMSRTFSVKKEE